MKAHSFYIGSRYRRAAIRFVLAVFALLVFASCAGKRALVDAGTPRPFIADSAVAEAMAMQPPSGVDPAVFNKLRDELVRQLTLRAEGKLASAAPIGSGAQVRDLAYDAGTGELTWSYANAGDYNIDGIVGVADITPLATYFGANTTDGLGNDALETWLDGDGSGTIGIGDITPLAMGFGFEVDSYMIMSGDAPTTAFTQTGSADFSTRNTTTIPPTFAYVNTGLPTSGAYCKVVPRDSLSVAGIDSLPLNIATGGVIISTGTIGPEGGTLDGGEVTVVFEEGAFADDTPLTLEDGPDDEYDEQVSDGFYIRGLPDTFSEPVTISIKLNTLPGEGDNYMLSLDEGEVWASSAGGVSHGAVHFTGEIADGVFTASIPPTAPDSGVSSLRSVSAETDKTVYITVVNRRHYLMSNSGKFLVYFPAGDEVLASAIADALDGAYTQIESLGLSWASRTTWPMETAVKIRSADSPDGESFTSRLWGVNGAHMEFNSTNLSSSNDLAIATAGHELLHVAQYLYDNRNRVSSSVSDGGWLWLDEATATWFEKEMPVSAGYIPNTVEQNLYAIEEALETNTQGHGYGESMFITYLARKQGDTVVGDIIKKKWNGYPPIDALKSATSSLIDSDWQFFAESFMKLAVYGASTFPAAANIVAMQRGSFTFDATPDASTTFTWNSAPNLSIRMFRVQFSPLADWNEYDNLLIKFYGENPGTAPVDATYIVSKYASGTYSYVGNYSSNEFRLTNLKPTADAQGAYYFLVVNRSLASPYSGARSTPINLQISREEDLLARLQNCSELYFDVNCKAKYQYGETIFPDYYLRLIHIFETIQWAGNSFESDIEYNGPNLTFHVQGTVDPVARTVNLVYAELLDWGTQSLTRGTSGVTYVSLPLRLALSSRVSGDCSGPACETYVTNLMSQGHRDYEPHNVDHENDDDHDFMYSEFAFLTEGHFIVLNFRPPPAP